MGKNEDPVKKAARQARYRETHRQELATKQGIYRKAHRKEENRRTEASHKRKAIRERAEAMTKPTPCPTFTSIDGEAHREAMDRSVYSFLRASGLKPLVNRQGLHTEEILEYLFTIPPKNVIVGFVLNYDWENWLCDLPDDAYRYITGDNEIVPEDGSEWDLVRKKDGTLHNNTIKWRGYTLSYFPRKILTVSKPGPGGKPRQRRVLDVWGYCQSSFVKACIDWGVASKEEMTSIEEGKGKRDIFTWEEMAYIEEYNRQELVLMDKLAEAIFKGVDEACRIADLPIRPAGRDLYGPGAIARKLMKEIDWPSCLGRSAIPDKYWPEFAETVLQAEDLQKVYLHVHPIIACYYGGRIEAAATGWWKKVYDADLHSAYPSAITRLPFWPSKMTFKKFCDPVGSLNWIRAKRPLGMFYVMWRFPGGWNWYPFPTRQKKYQNVYYPQNGQGWICSAELFAVLDTIPEEQLGNLYVYYAWTIPGKYGYGGGEKALPEGLKSPIARMIERMYTVRAEAKAQGLTGAQMALKLILNSLYGKLLQQVGVTLENPGLFHDLIAAWITSWTRAMIYRAIAPHRKGKNIIAVQTDGIVSKKPLDLPLSPDLAAWEMEALPDYRQLLPGLYDYDDGKGGRKVRRRGMPKTFEFEKAWATMYQPGERYTIRYRTFLGRRLYLAQPNEFEGLLYQWPCMEKHFRPDLGAKRGNPLNGNGNFGDCYLQPGKKESWLPPKTNTQQGPGLPFVLKFDEPPHIPEEDWEIEVAALMDSEDESISFFRE